MPIKFSPIRVREETDIRIEKIAKITGKTKTGLLEELVNAVWAVAVNFKDANLSYETCMTASTVTIEVTGKNRMITGSVQVPDNATEEEADEAIRKDIASKTKSEKGVNS